ncbi:SDR family oxidoreductase [Pseudomonas sp. F1_0610]|uniref:SDR family oxidoreductase n=1 Tax=Pseudomonas sp. F1_0610 TaxID=3114284 RepID=UPI0039C0AD2D
MTQKKCQKILIIGCGDLGMRLVRGLTAQGWEVYALRRTIVEMPESARQIVADVTSSHLPADWPTDYDYVVYSIAASEFTEQGYRAAYVQGLQNVLTWLANNESPLKRFIFTSSTAVYGQTDGQWVNEDSVTEPNRWNGQLMLEAEQLAQTSGYPATVVRLSGIYGPNRDHLVQRALAGYSAHKGSMTNRIHVQDAADFLLTLLAQSEAGAIIDNCYLVNDDLPVELEDVLAWLRQELNITIKESLFMPAMAGSKRCDNARAKALGWQPKYPDYRIGYAPMIAPLLSKNGS